MNWIRVTQPGNIPAREGRAVQLGERSVAVFNLGERFVALDNRCPHGGGPLADGIVGGATVTCPLHNWQFCLESGSVTKPCETGAAGVQTYPVKIEDNILLLGFEDAEAAV
jgi:nitrite reductase (NADH) small subunit